MPLRSGVEAKSIGGISGPVKWNGFGKLRGPRLAPGAPPGLITMYKKASMRLARFRNRES
jgi:hypothetical protein